MHYPLMLLSLLATLKATGVMGFGGGYVQESIGGLVVDPQDQAERELINAEVRAGINNYGDTGLLITHVKSEDGRMVLNISCNKSEMAFQQTNTPQQVRCNLTYELTVPIALSFEIDYPPVAHLAPAFWLHLQPTSSGQVTIPLNLTILGVRMGVAYLRIWAHEAIGESGSGLYVWHNWSRSDPLLVEAYLSTLANRSMMPLTLFIYGRFFLDVHQIQIPYEEIAIQLLYVVVPVVLGMLVKYYLPKMATRVQPLMRPMSLTFIAVLVGFGTYVNLEIFALCGPYPLLLPTAAALPWTAFLAAGLIAYLLRRPRAEILTIAIETGIQNIGIAVLVLIYSMPQPEGDIGAVMSLVVSMFTPLPLMIALIVLWIREMRCACCRRRPQCTSLAPQVDIPDCTDDFREEEGDECERLAAVLS
ncbi:hypothetical protein SprV_0802607000 [Sparganum proliferum]